MREADLEVVSRLDLRDVLVRKAETEGRDVAGQVRGFAATDDGEGVGCCITWTGEVSGWAEMGERWRRVEGGPLCST